MKYLKNCITENGISFGTGWLPPVPDLRDYSEVHPVIRDVLASRSGEGEGERGRLRDKEIKGLRDSDRLSDKGTKGLRDRDTRGLSGNQQQATSNKQPATSNHQPKPT